MQRRADTGHCSSDQCGCLEKSGEISYKLGHGAFVGDIGRKRWMTKATETAVKMLESLPEELQERVVEELRDLVQEARDESRWDELFDGKKAGLAAAARKARKDIAEGKATEMDYRKL